MLNDEHETPGRTEISFLRLAKQLKKRAYHGDDLPGRPFAVAIIPKDREEIVKLRFKYQEIVNQLTYQEGMALMRALNKTWSTFLQRKYAHRPPSLEEIILTTQWFDSGKPIQFNKHHRGIASLL